MNHRDRFEVNLSSDSSIFIFLSVILLKRLILCYLYDDN